MLKKFKPHTKLTLCSLSFVLGLTTNAAFAETLAMPQAIPSAISGATPPSFSVTLPGRGMSMTEVLEQFGEPTSKDPEVGEPPITRWHYSNYNVIFEYQYVIHALTIKKPMGMMEQAPTSAEVGVAPEESPNTSMPETHSNSVPAESEYPPAH